MYGIIKSEVKKEKRKGVIQMDKKDFREILQYLLEEEQYSANDIKAVDTYENAGYMTADEGLVVTMEDNSKFQITIVQER